MKPLALAALFVVITAWGCKSGSDDAGTNVPTPQPAPATGGTTTVAAFAAARDVFTANCVGCHSGTDPKEGLDLTSHAMVMKGAKDGAVVVPGDPAGSRIIKAMRHSGAKAMPPEKPMLSDDKIQAVEAWIKDGAKE